MNTAKDLRKLMQISRQNLRMISAIRPNLFRHIRPGYAIWFMCARSKNPISIDEIAEGLVCGKVVTTLETKDLYKAAKRLADYHVKAGKLKRLPNDFYTNAR